MWIEKIGLQSTSKRNETIWASPPSFTYISVISIRSCISVPDILAYLDSRPEVDFAKFVACPFHSRPRKIADPNDSTMDELYDVSVTMSRLRHPLIQ